MNIFALSDSPVNSARWQHDKHVVKMVLETAQLISQAISLRHDWLRYCPEPENLYRITHKHHPSAVWCRKTVSNMRWLIEHGYELGYEYRRRYLRTHKSMEIIELGRRTFIDIPYDGLGQTPFPMCMPEKYKCEDPVLAYRRYYINEKLPGQRYTRTDHLPNWILREIV